MIRVVTILSLLALPALAQQPQPDREYTFTAAGLQRIVNMVMEVNARQANPIMNEIQQQVAESDRRAAAKIAAEPRPKPAK